MSLRELIKQDVAGVAAAAEAELIAKATDQAGRAAPPDDARRRSAPPSAATRGEVPHPSRAELLLPTVPWWLEIAAVPGDAMHGPPGCDGAADDASASLAASTSPLAVLGLDATPADPQPRGTPAPCTSCGCPLFWEDLARVLHCCQCTPLPGRRILRGLWRLVWNVEAWLPPLTPGGLAPLTSRPGHAAWARYEPRRWNPFERLEAAEREAAAKENEGF